MPEYELKMLAFTGIQVIPNRLSLGVGTLECRVGKLRKIAATTRLHHFARLAIKLVWTLTFLWSGGFCNSEFLLPSDSLRHPLQCEILFVLRTRESIRHILLRRFIDLPGVLANLIFNRRIRVQTLFERIHSGSVANGPYYSWSVTGISIPRYHPYLAGFHLSARRKTPDRGVVTPACL